MNSAGQTATIGARHDQEGQHATKADIAGLKDDIAKLDARADAIRGQAPIKVEAMTDAHERRISAPESSPRSPNP